MVGEELRSDVVGEQNREGHGNAVSLLGEFRLDASFFPFRLFGNPFIL